MRWNVVLTCSASEISQGRLVGWLTSTSRFTFTTSIIGTEFGVQALFHLRRLYFDQAKLINHVTL
jgi:hypothetical protein